MSTRYIMTPAAVREQLTIMKEQLALKANAATTYSKTEIDSKVSTINASIAAAQTAAYKPAGSVTFANLPTPAEALLGNVYDVTDEFTTTANFVEGAGHKYPGGTEVGVVLRDGSYKYNVFSGFTDFAAFVKNADCTEISDTDVRGYWNDINSSQSNS